MIATLIGIVAGYVIGRWLSPRKRPTVVYYGLFPVVPQKTDMEVKN